MPTPPRTVSRPSRRVHHGDRFTDEYAWLADKSDQRVLDHLRAENEYTDLVMASAARTREQIVAEIKGRTQETDLSVPVGYRGWWYYTRTQEGHQYAAHCRAPRSPAEVRPEPAPGQPWPGEQVLVDGDVEAAGGEYFALGGLDDSPDGQLVAFGVDRSGDERFDVVVRRIADGVVVDEGLRGVGYGLIWTADSASLIYTRLDESWRPHEVWCHRVGSDPREDVRLLLEPDERFWLGIGSSRDDRQLVVSAGSKTTSECWLGDLTAPVPTLTSVAGRIPGWEYDVEPAGDGLLVTHNANSVDFEVAWMPWPRSPGEAAPAGLQDGQCWLPPTEGVRYLGVEAFAGHVVVVLREGGLASLRLAPRTGAGPGGLGEPARLAPDEELYALGMESNPDWASTVVRVVHESFVTPRTIAEVGVADGSWTVLKRQEVLGGYTPQDYVQRREWAPAPDGVSVPLSLVHRRGVEPDGTAPVLLYAYGAYETSLDPWFSIPRLSLLDRGVVFAVAHVRGGGEMGRGWYEQGKLAAKPTTFSDLVACARHLHLRRWCAPDRLAVEGASAGGLTVGAALNLAPELFAAAHLDVPFVDALTTMLDESLPLTIPEWEEWGDPLHDAAAYALMKSYSPYENVRAAAYPAVLATTSLNDTRVLFTEPAKWVARLRAVATQDQDARPILLRTEMTAGHGGRSGRYDAWEQYAFEAAFLLKALGVDG